MIRRRPDVQVVTSSAQMDTAMGEGIPSAVLAELVAARAAWHAVGVVPALTSWARAALLTSSACEWDAVFTHAARRVLAERD